MTRSRARLARLERDHGRPPEVWVLDMADADRLVRRVPISEHDEVLTVEAFELLPPNPDRVLIRVCREGEP